MIFLSSNSIFKLRFLKIHKKRGKWFNLSIFVNIQLVFINVKLKFNKIGHFNWYSKYIDYFNLFVKPHSSIFLTWPPSRMNFIAFLRYNFIYIFRTIIFVKDAHFFHRLLYLLKELSLTFLFDKCIAFKKTWICFDFNIFCQYSMFRQP